MNPFILPSGLFAVGLRAGTDRAASAPVYVISIRASPEFGPVRCSGCVGETARFRCLFSSARVLRAYQTGHRPLRDDDCRGGLLRVRGGRADLLQLSHTLLGTVLATAGALALNQYVERDLDALMERTRTRPIPSGRLRPRDALLFGLLLVIGGVAHLWATVGVLPAALTLGSAAAYNLVYTPLKSRSHTATFAGAVPGAMPALIGWSAASGSIGPGALALFGIAFVWQIPHVLALAWLLREDYARAGFLLSPPADPEGKMIGRLMIVYSAALIAVSAVPTALGLTGVIYLVGAFILGVGFLWRCVGAWREMSPRAVRNVFLGSLAYQPLLLGLMLLDTVRV